MWRTSMQIGSDAKASKPYWKPLMTAAVNGPPGARNLVYPLKQ